MSEAAKSRSLEIPLARRQPSRAQTGDAAVGWPFFPKIRCMYVCSVAVRAAPRHRWRGSWAGRKLAALISVATES